MNRKEAYVFLSSTLKEPKNVLGILSLLLNIRKEDYVLDSSKELTLLEVQKIKEAIHRLNNDEPLSKILGTREFWSLDFYVTKDTLDPRPDTETLVELALELFPKNDRYHFLELGVGTGCIIISLLKEYLNSNGVGVDISDQALNIASQNRDAHGLQYRLDLLESNWFDGVTGQYDLIISNPPYIPTQEIESLDRVVKEYDPVLALDGGGDGLLPYEIIASKALDYVKPWGKIILEVGFGQAEDVKEIFKRYGFHFVKSRFDLGGIERALCFSGNI